MNLAQLHEGKRLVIHRRNRNLDSGFDKVSVTVTEVRSDRVVGFSNNVPKTPFDVKLADGKFSVGSGSGKCTFYLSDAGKV